MILLFASILLLTSSVSMGQDSDSSSFQNLLATVTAATSCDDLYELGSRDDKEYEIRVNNTWITVFCKFGNSKSNDTHSIVLQRRVPGGNQSFYQNWESYKNGFGDMNGEFWLGLEHLHTLTSSAEYGLHVTATDYYNHSYNGWYKNFQIGSEDSNYILTLDGYYDDKNNKSDSLFYNNGHAFSTHDQDHDQWSGNCAVARRGGWWFNKCSLANPNGKRVGNVTGNAQAMYMYQWSQLNALMSVSLKMFLKN